MLDYRILANKNKIKLNGEDVYDLLSGKSFVDMKLSNGNFVVVNKYYVARPDLISLACYGEDMYGDIICKVNGISNPFELNEGDIIICPDISDISYFYYLENPDERDPDAEGAAKRPKAKGKNEKRKPNEAVIGDKRFKIDQTRKVIVY